MDSDWTRHLCATGFVGTGQWGIPDVHLGGDTTIVLLAAVALLGLTLWTHRRFGTGSTAPLPDASPLPALASAVDEAYAAADLTELEVDPQHDDRELVDA